MKKILFAGFPCTKFSIAQTKNRETHPYSGEGWELFYNAYLAKEKFKPDFFLFENNYSISKDIKDAVSEMLGVHNYMINSALVSAQTRKREYWFNWDVEQPEDRGILLKDILESGTAWREKAYCLDANYFKASNGTNAFNGKQSGQRLQAAENIIALSDREMQYMVRETKDGRNHFDYGYIHDGTRDKSKCLVANIYKGVPYNVICDPIRIGTIKNEAKNKEFDSKQYRVYSSEGKSTTLCGQGGGVGAKTGLYACKVHDSNGREIPVYCVENNNIIVDGEKHHINLSDGYYIIRKLTVRECSRLQTLPDDYCKAVSNSQAYKCLGNGWTAEVIIHILREGLKDVPRDERLVVMSMYDGISTALYCLKQLGFTNIEFHSYEIDKYAIKVSEDNFPSEVIRHGDAFALRNENWGLYTDGIEEEAI